MWRAAGYEPKDELDAEPSVVRKPRGDVKYRWADSTEADKQSAKRTCESTFA